MIKIQVQTEDKSFGVYDSPVRPSVGDTLHIDTDYGSVRVLVTCVDVFVGDWTIRAHGKEI